MPPRSQPPGQPPQDQLPAAAAPASGMPIGGSFSPYFPPQPQPAAPQSLSGGGDVSLGDRLGNGLQTFLHGLGGPAALLGDTATALITGRRQDAQGMAQDQQQRTYSQLVKAGTPPDQAMIIATNPQAMQAWITQQVAPKYQHVDSTDLLGQKTPMVFNQTTGKYTDAGGNPIGGQGGATSSPVGADGSPLQGQELLHYLEKTNPPAAAGVKAIIAGDINAAGRNLQMLLPIAKLVDPTMNQADYQSRMKTRIDATTGRTAREIRALNTSTSHANDLYELIDQLGSSTMLPGVINPVSTAVRGQLSPDFQRLKGLYDSKAEALAGELPKAFNGGQTAEGDRAKYRAMLDINKSPEEKKAAVKSLMELMQGRLGAIADTYNQGMGTAREGIHFLSPENQEIFTRLKNGNPASSPTDLPHVATPADAMKLPSGTQFIDANGVRRVRP